MIGIILGIVGILLGIVIMVLGSMWGIAVLLAGVAAMAFSYATMMRGRGYDPNQGTLNGLGGQGKQQSEAVKVPQPNSGEQPANIWDVMEKE